MQTDTSRGAVAVCYSVCTLFDQEGGTIPVEVKCSGCGFREPNDNRQKIRPVTLTIGDPESWRAGQHTEYLCDTCSNAIVRLYFRGAPVTEVDALPSFIEARRAE